MKITIAILIVFLNVFSYAQEYTITDTFVVFHHPTEDVVVNTGGSQVWNTLNSFHTGNAIRYFSNDGNAANSGLDSLHPLPYTAIDTIIVPDSTIFLTKRGETVSERITISGDYVRLCTGWGYGDSTIFNELMCDNSLYPHVQIGNIGIIIRYYGGDLPDQYLTIADYYVRSDATGTGDGTDSLSNAWTLAQLNAATLSAGDVVGLAHDDVFEGSITLTASGSSGNKITIGTYGYGQKAVIKGDAEITGWTLHSGNIYKATFNTTISQLFIDGVRYAVARTPNTGYYTINTVNSSTSFTSSDLDGGTDYSGAILATRTTAWTLAFENISSSSSTTLTVASSPNFGFVQNYGFFLMNKLAFLDSPGEWYYDDVTNTVYLWTPNGDSPSNYTITGTTQNTGINIGSQDYVIIQDLNIKNYSVYGIYGSSSSYITLDNNNVADIGGIAINLGYYSGNTGITVSNNTVTGAIDRGIRVSTSNGTIYNNTVEDIGLIADISIPAYTADGEFNCSAMDISLSGNSISYNKIRNVGYNGIFFFGQNNIFEYNRIDSFTLSMSDGGGIYTTGLSNYATTSSQGSIIRYNIVSNGIGNNSGTTITASSPVGLYLDECSNDIVMNNNTVFNCSKGIALNKDRQITLTDNVLYNNRDYQFDTNDNGNHTTATGNSFTENVYITLNNEYSLVKANADFPVSNYETHDYNYFYSQNDYAAFVNWTTGYSFANWQTNAGVDANSTLIPTSVAASDVVLFYNATSVNVAQDLGTDTWEDLDGASVTSLTLGAFESKVLIRQ